METEKLKRIIAPVLGLLPEDLPEILKYKGKTGVPFTRFMINTAAALPPCALSANPLTLLDIMAVDDNILDDLAVKLNAQKLGGYLNDELSEREKTIIVLRYGLNGQEPMTQKNVAKRLGISRSYVSRLETKALKQLRKRFEGG